MGYPTDHLETLSEHLAKVSVWIDDAAPNAARDAEARTWGRIAKVAEECGEVIAAYIGATGQNPRKGYTHTQVDVATELLDVALTALAAYEHVTGNRAAVGRALLKHTEGRMERVGLL